MNLRSKVLGMLVGGGIGDALGMPVETWTPEKICEVHGGPLTGYADPIEHKWFYHDQSQADPKKIYMPAGSVTDDTQLTIATMKGIINGHKSAMKAKSFDPYMDAIAAAHVAAMNESTAGWGNTTVEAIKRLAVGVSWKDSGKTDEERRGTGNGIPMKCSPLAAWRFSKAADKIAEVRDPGEAYKFQFYQMVVDYSAMTHWTVMAAESGIIHCASIINVLNLNDSEEFSALGLNHAIEAIWGNKMETTFVKNSPFWTAQHLNKTKDQIHNRMSLLSRLTASGNLWYKDDSYLREIFGDGSCYVYDSLPFAYAFFLRNPMSVQSILDAANAGGDTDTNAKIVGELIGALHGIEFFLKVENKWTTEGLLCFQELMDLGNEFCDTLGID